MPPYIFHSVTEARKGLRRRLQEHSAVARTKFDVEQVFSAGSLHPQECERTEYPYSTVRDKSSRGLFQTPPLGW